MLQQQVDVAKRDLLATEALCSPTDSASTVPQVRSRQQKTKTAADWWYVLLTLTMKRAIFILNVKFVAAMVALMRVLSLEGGFLFVVATDAARRRVTRPLTGAPV
jgi:hypothetical protein